LSSETIIRKNEIEKFKYYLKIINNAEIYLRSEELSKFRKYFINIFSHDSFHNWRTFDQEKSLKGVEPKFYRMTPNDDEYSHSKIILIIYLISEKRIIKLSLNDEKLITSEEHIIQKDLKKVEINNNREVYFHYHGLHVPDILVMDSYEAAVNLRKEISELRENKFNSGIKKPQPPFKKKSQSTK
jgi:hypothetical protein